MVNVPGKRPPLVDRLADAFASSPARADLRVALLFGSAASGRMHAGSDADVGILPLSQDLPLQRELELQAELERAAGLPIHLVRLDLVDALLRWEVARSGRVLFEATPGSAAHFRAQAAIEHAEIGPLIEQGAERWRRAVVRRAGARR